MQHDTSNHAFTLADRELQYKTAMELYRLHEQLYAVVEKINADQRTLKAATAQDAKSKAAVADYNARLEALRNTLLASTQTSIFADERRLREQISEVYSSVAGNEARPTNLQIARVAVLKEEVEKAEKAYAALEAKYADKARAAAAPMKRSESSRGGG
jgi:chromosome segregation ATPase